MSDKKFVLRRIGALFGAVSCFYVFRYIGYETLMLQWIYIHGGYTYEPLHLQIFVLGMISIGCLIILFFGLIALITAIFPEWKEEKEGKEK